jgi:amino-acid N-acetyltransferase
MEEKLVIRPARMSDVPGICELVNYYAERGRMLHRSMESLYDSLREFMVAVNDQGKVVGCVAVDIFWADLAEIRSLAVAQEVRGQGLGAMLVEAAAKDAQRVEIRKLFALTYEKNFFLRAKFEVIERDMLPEKVWRECIACPKVDCCDEIAMMRVL